MKEQAKRFGMGHLYAADTFIEMRPPGDDPTYLGDLAGAVYDGMIQRDDIRCESSGALSLAYSIRHHKPLLSPNC